MAPLRRFFFRLVNALHPGRAEPDLTRELSSHLTFLEDDLRRRGLTPEGARLAAHRTFNGIDQTKERHRDARSFVGLDDLRRDLGVGLVGAAFTTRYLGSLLFEIKPTDPVTYLIALRYE